MTKREWKIVGIRWGILLAAGGLFTAAYVVGFFVGILNYPGGLP